MTKDKSLYDTLKNPYLISTAILILLIVIYISYKWMQRRELKKLQKERDANTKTVEVTLRENYRDPIFMNRYKLMYDYYPRSNGSIYGLPIKYGGNWHLFSGFPMYDRVY